MIKSKKQHKAKQQILNSIPIFLAKTYRIVNNPEYHDIVCWSDDMEGFVVKDINRLTTEVFPKHFKHSNFSSFVRQLNMYGFHKVKSEEDGHVFTHELFQKDNVEKLKEIKRKNGNTSDPEQPNETNMMVPLKQHYDSDIQKELNSIRRKHEDLQGCVSMLVDQNKEILMQNRNFVNKMSKREEKYRNKLETLMLLLLFGKGKNSSGKPFILPEHFQNMLQSFQEANPTIFQSNGSGLEKVPGQKRRKLNQPLFMLKNQSEHDSKEAFQQKNRQIDNLLTELNGGEKVEGVDSHLEFEDSPGIIPPLSPNPSCISFPELYKEESHRNEVNDFLDKLHNNSDYEDNMSVSVSASGPQEKKGL